MVLIGIISINTDKHTAFDRLIKHFFVLNKMEEKDVVLAHYENGKPYAKGAENLFVSLSDSGDYRIIAISQSAVGIDIEKIREIDYKKISARYNFTASNKEEFFYKFCTAECYVKLNGTPLLSALKIGNNLTSKRLPFLKGYETVVVSEDESVFIISV